MNHYNNSPQQMNPLTSNINSVLNNDIDIAKQLLISLSGLTDINEIVTILLSTLSPSTSQLENSVVQSSTLTKISTPSSTTLSTTTTASQFNFDTFMKLRSEYIGPINPHIIHAMPHQSENVKFNHTLFQAALLTNSPTIIDQIMKYIQFDFTTLNIPHDQVDTIQSMNVINSYESDLNPNNSIIIAIVETIKQGLYESILHLINHYHLSPTIPICDHRFYSTYGFTNLFYYAVMIEFSPTPIIINNNQLITYLLPLCFDITSPALLGVIIENVAQRGHLNILQIFHNQYNINLAEITNRAILAFAVQSKEPCFELIDYLIDVVGIDPNEMDCNALVRAMRSKQWDNFKYLLPKCNTQNEQLRQTMYELLQYSYGLNFTPDVFDLIVETFEIDVHSVDDDDDEPMVFWFTRTSNVQIVQHLIEKYNIDPSMKSNGYSLLECALPNKSSKTSSSIEMIKYLLTFNFDINQIRRDQLKPIQTITYTPNFNQECRLDIFKLLLEHNAVIDDIDQFLSHTLYNGYLSILQYLIETWEPKINVGKITSTNSCPLLHSIVCAPSPPIKLIQYIIDSNEVDINDLHKGASAVYYALTNSYLNLDVIKLLINNGAKVTMNDWLTLTSRPYRNLDVYFQCLDYFQGVFGWGLQHGSIASSDKIELKTVPLLQFTTRKFVFSYPAINDPISINQAYYKKVIIYRALIHRYKANVNDQDYDTKNTVFHYLAGNRHIELIHFTLLHSFHKPNIWLLNTKGQTFLHILISHLYEPCQEKRMSTQNFTTKLVTSKLNMVQIEEIHTDLLTYHLQKVLDCIMDLL